MDKIEAIEIEPISKDNIEDEEEDIEESESEEETTNEKESGDQVNIEEVPCSVSLLKKIEHIGMIEIRAQGRTMEETAQLFNHLIEEEKKLVIKSNGNSKDNPLTG